MVEGLGFGVWDLRVGVQVHPVWRLGVDVRERECHWV